MLGAAIEAIPPVVSISRVPEQVLLTADIAQAVSSMSWRARCETVDAAVASTNSLHELGILAAQTFERLVHPVMLE